MNPRTPRGYSGYLINTKKYLLHKNASTNASRLAIPLILAPSQLSEPMKELFDKQEQERYKLRQQHLIEGVGFILAAFHMFMLNLSVVPFQVK